MTADLPEIVSSEEQMYQEKQLAKLEAKKAKEKSNEMPEMQK